MSYVWSKCEASWDDQGVRAAKAQRFFQGAIMSSIITDTEHRTAKIKITS